MTGQAQTPGQAAYEAFQRAFPTEDWGPWESLGDPTSDEEHPHAGWGTVAEAAIGAKVAAMGDVKEIAWENIRLANENRALREAIGAAAPAAAAQERPAPGVLFNSKQERHPSREVNLITDDERDYPEADDDDSYEPFIAASGERDVTEIVVRPAPELAALKPTDADFMAEIMAERDQVRHRLAEVLASEAVTRAERDDLAKALDERNRQLDDFTHAVIDLDTSEAIVKAARAVRKKAGMTSIDQFSKSTQPEEP